MILVSHYARLFKRFELQHRKKKAQCKSHSKVILVCMRVIWDFFLLNSVFYGIFLLNNVFYGIAISWNRSFFGEYHGIGVFLFDRIME